MNTARLAAGRPNRGSRTLLAALVVGLAATPLVAGSSRDDNATGPAKQTTAKTDLLAPELLAGRIDELLQASWTAEKVEPSPVSDDAEFMRRVYLDLAGRIPSVGEARAFLNETDPAKRHKLVDQLLGRATFPAHLGRTLRDLMLPGANANIQLFRFVSPFEDWLRLRLADDMPYDRLVRELLNFTASGPINVRANLNLTEPSPIAFYQFNEQKPENLAASAARLFLGVHIECAQCHNHPFAKWKREDFWSLAAFFGTNGPQQRPNAIAAVADSNERRGIQIPGTNTTVSPRLLDGSAPDWQQGEGTRARLARWITSADNPYFARTAANRLWAHFFGRGLVDPVDDYDEEANPPSHPDVLSELARQFVYHQFDIKYLVRAITATRAYQLSSLTTHASQDEPTRFARMPLRSMTGEQLFDSVAEATGYQESIVGPRGALVVQPNSPRAAFSGKFADSGPTRVDYQASILQALTLMNGQIVTAATNVRNSTTLVAVLDAPFFDTPRRIETLFLATLSRRPNSEDLAKMQAHVERAGSADAESAALADVFWALLNSAEFVLNH